MGIGKRRECPGRRQKILKLPGRGELPKPPEKKDKDKKPIVPPVETDIQ